MITSCSHTFCSLCIRRCLAVDGKCPACRGAEQEVKLRRNWIVQEVVDAFHAARGPVLSLAREAAEAPTRATAPRRRGKRKADDAELNGEGEPARKTRSQSRMETGPQTAQYEVVLDDESQSDMEPDDGLVACPMCGRRMKEESVYTHIDRCDGERNQKPAEPQRTTQIRHQSHRPSPPNPVSTRLPQLNYSLYRENPLRKKLAELGIRSTGPKSLLEKRHLEWVNLWNANCDSTRPRSKRELLQELDTWERSQGALAPGSGAADKGSVVMRKDFDGEAWAKKHSDDFKRLVATARPGKALDGVGEPAISEGPASSSSPSRNGAEEVPDPIRESSPEVGSDEPRVPAASQRARPSSSPMKPPGFLSSPPSQRMFEDADDPIVDAGSSTAVR
ncbi:MAG: E3 ubiquitin-protein ligase rad18 [Piccolia ochrophora]|nr:MAG: E3 ubiquitin-protein ligase rad18 [Piccolia ochrophora]